MNPLQLVLVFYQLAQQKAKAYADGIAKNTESTANKIKSLDGWITGKKPDAYPSADAVTAALEKIKPGEISTSTSGKTLNITIKEVS